MMETAADVLVPKKVRPEFIKKPFKGRIYFTGLKPLSTMVIPFGKHFPFGQPFENFKMSLSSKRTFNRSILEIADDNNRVLSHSCTEKIIDTTTGEMVKTHYNKDGELSNEFIFNYLSLKMNLDEGGELTKVDYSVFISELMNLISDDILKVIIDYVNVVYVGSMDEAIDMTKHTFKLATTFLDVEIKQLCHVKYAGNLIIPLCTHYCNIMSRNVEPKDFFLDLYKSLFERVSINSEVNTLEKLHRYITMIVGNAFKSHKIYERMSIIGTTKDSEIEEVFSKILTTIITKLDPIDTVPALIAETAKNSSSKYKPRENDGYNVLQGFSDDYVHSGGDDSIVTEAERMESRIARPDELLKVVRKYSCDDTINKISVRYGVYIENIAEYNHTVNTMDLHEYQTRVIFNIFSGIYGGFENVYDNNRHNYSRLLILCDKYLRKMDLPIIADYVSSRCIGYNFQNRWGGKISDRKLFEDPRYDQLINGKYRFAKSQFERHNFIRDDIVFLANNKFNYNGCNDPRIETPIKHTDDEIIDAVLSFYLKVM